MKNLVGLYGVAIDFCEVFIPQRQKVLLEDCDRQRDSRIYLSEINAMIIGFPMKNHGDFKKRCITITSVPMPAFFISLKGKPSGVEIIAATTLIFAITFVCHGIKL